MTVIEPYDVVYMGVALPAGALPVVTYGGAGTVVPSGYRFGCQVKPAGEDLWTNILEAGDGESFRVTVTKSILPPDPLERETGLATNPLGGELSVFTMILLSFLAGMFGSIIVDFLFNFWRRK